MKKKGMPIEIGIKRLSKLKDKGLISDEIFMDSKELLMQSEMEILMKKSTQFDLVYINNLQVFKFNNDRIFLIFKKHRC